MCFSFSFEEDDQQAANKTVNLHKDLLRHAVRLGERLQSSYNGCLKPM